MSSKIPGSIDTTSLRLLASPATCADGSADGYPPVNLFDSGVAERGSPPAAAVTAKAAAAAVAKASYFPQPKPLVGGGEGRLASKSKGEGKNKGKDGKQGEGNRQWFGRGRVLPPKASPG